MNSSSDISRRCIVSAICGICCWRKRAFSSASNLSFAPEATNIPWPRFFCEFAVVPGCFSQKTNLAYRWFCCRRMAGQTQATRTSTGWQAFTSCNSVPGILYHCGLYPLVFRISTRVYLFPVLINEAIHPKIFIACFATVAVSVDGRDCRAKDPK